MKKCYTPKTKTQEKSSNNNNKKITKRNRCHSSYSISFENRLHSSFLYSVLTSFIRSLVRTVSCARYCPDNENRTKIVNEVLLPIRVVCQIFLLLLLLLLPSFLVRNSRNTASFCHLAKSYTEFFFATSAGEYLETDEEAGAGAAAACKMSV